MMKEFRFNYLSKITIKNDKYLTSVLLVHINHPDWSKQIKNNRINHV